MRQASFQPYNRLHDRFAVHKTGHMTGHTTSCRKKSVHKTGHMTSQIEHVIQQIVTKKLFEKTGMY